MRSERTNEIQNRKKSRVSVLRKVSTALGALVVFATTYALILPAITMEAPVYCGSEAHVHTSQCYTPMLICGYEEAPALPAEPETDPACICGLEEHVHDETCFDEAGNLVCETEEHTHTADCYSPAEPEPAPHVHTADCYGYVLTCEIPEHEHTLQCFSDPAADTDAARWEKAADQALEALGERSQPGDKVAAVAASQEQYGESALNYFVEEDGATKAGYTFYGAAYGAPYADWNALYPDWVLQKAGVPGFPLGASADEWYGTLAESDRNLGTAFLKHGEPRVGDLVFVRTADAPEETVYANRVGIVHSVTDKGVYAYEGDCGDRVCLTFYETGSVAGYGAMPEVQIPGQTELADTPASEPEAPPAPEPEIQTEPEPQTEPGPEMLGEPPLEETDSKDWDDWSWWYAYSQTGQETPAEAARPVEEAPDSLPEQRVYFSDEPMPPLLSEPEAPEIEPAPEQAVTADPEMIAAMAELEQKEKKPAPLQPVVDFFSSLFSSGYDYRLTAELEGVTVTAEYDEGALPEGTAMAVTPVAAEPYEALVSQATGREGAELLSYDISFLSGHEIVEPEGEVKISFQADFLEEKAEPEIVHIRDGGAQVIEGLVSEGEISGVTDSFSVYVLSYTVDFHYEINGKAYEFSIPGGGAVTLGELLKTLEITSEQDALLRQVEQVTFSDPRLLWVGKTEADCTVGSLIEAQQLETQYSADQSEEEIAALKARPLSQGEWVLISLQPFLSEETLTVTMKNGDVFTVRVTDAQYTGTAVSALNGATGALINKQNLNAVLGTAQSATALRSISVGLSGDQITTADGSPALTEWTFTYRGNWNGYDHYQIQCPDGYLNLGSGSATVSATPQDLIVVTRQSGGETQVRIANDNHDALNNTGNSTANGYSGYNNWGYTSNPGEWFTVSKLGPANVPHVTVHYVDRNGNPLTGVTYNGTNPLVTQNEDGTFSIPYDWRGKTTETSVNLGSQFSKEGYTYASTHLDGVDGTGTYLKQGGLVIDATLTASGSTLNFLSDSGETNPNYTGNPPMGNLAYGSLTPGSLTGRISRRPSTDGNILPYAISNNKDIYVILDPLPTNSFLSGGLSTNPGQVADPTLKKTMEPNNDGTYTLSLKVDAHAQNDAEGNRANILFVVDTSSSMRAITYDNAHNRILDTHDAVKGFGEKLLDYNTNHPQAVQVAMLTFDGTVEERLNWTDSKTSFQTAADEYLRYYYLHTGTDWEDAMKETLAKLQSPPDSDPTFVVFFTDGEPSQYTNFHGKGQNNNANPINPSERSETVTGGYPNFYSYFLSRETSKDEMRAIVDTGARLYGIYAYNTTEDDYNGEDGAAMLHNAIRYGYNTNANLSGSLFYEATSTGAVQSAFDSIYNLITETVGFTNVVVQDGIAAGVTSSTVVNGDVSGFTYIIRDKTGAVDYQVQVAPNGVPAGQTVESGKPIFTLKDGSKHVGEIRSVATSVVKVDSTTGAPILDDSDKLQMETVNVDVYYLENAGKQYIMPIATPNQNVRWDLSPLGILKDGYSYEVRFVVWPNQDAYDLVADLNNGKRTDLEEHWEQQPILTDGQGRQYRKGGITEYPYISRYEDGVYSAMSNTDQSVKHYKIDKKLVDGVEVTEITGPTTTTVPAPDPMRLTASRTHIEKQWNVERDPGIMAQYLYNTDGTPKKFKVEFDIYQEGSTTPYTRVCLGWDEETNRYVWSPDSPMTTVTYAGHTYTIGTRWTQNFAIATGLMLSSDRMDELGLDKSEFPSGRYTGDGKTYYLLETGHDYTFKENGENLGYEFDFISPVYHPMLVDNVLRSVTFTKTGNTISITKMSDANEELTSLLIENTLRGYINLEKIVVDKDGERLESDQTEFNYDVVLESSTDPGPFKGDSIPWYGVDGLFYHDRSGNYYQVYEDENKTWKLKDESGHIYSVTSEGFDPDHADLQTVVYRIDEEHSSAVELYGNQTTATADGKRATASLHISQNQVLNIANVPVGTHYTITERQKYGYSLIRILREIKDGDTVEESETITNVSGRFVEGDIVENRDNHLYFTNQFKPGAIKLQKKVEVDGQPPTAAQYELVDGDYVFSVTSTETVTEGETAVPAIVKYVRITVQNGVTASYRIADTVEGLETAETKTGSWALVPDLPEGNYLVAETEERNGLLLTGISRGDGDAEALDLDNDRLTVHVTSQDTTAANTNAQATFTNSYYNNHDPDRITLDIAKTFTGLGSPADIPGDFRVLVHYTVGDSLVPVELHLRRYQNETILAGGEHITIREDTSGSTLTWHITGIPHDAHDFQIRETGYDTAAGYTFEAASLWASATAAEADITETAGSWHNITIDAPTAALQKVTDDRRTSDSGSNVEFYLEDHDILLTKLTANQGTLVISRESLNTAERMAVEKGWPQQGGFKLPPRYFSIEEHPTGFQFGGKKITFGQDENGRTTVTFDQSASAQEDVFAVSYQNQQFLNNAALENEYVPSTVTLELYKVDDTDMTTPLARARFLLRSLDPEGTGAYLTGPGALEKPSGETGEDGKTTITGIPDGYYAISESQVPAGYILTDDEEFYIKVVRGVLTRITPAEDDPATPEVNEAKVKFWPEMTDNTGRIRLTGTRPAVADDPATTDVDESAEPVTGYKVGNTPGAELPASGGPGTWLYTLIGLLLLGGTALLVGRRRYA